MTGYAKMAKCIIRKVQHLPAQTREQQKAHSGAHKKLMENECTRDEPSQVTSQIRRNIEFTITAN